MLKVNCFTLNMFSYIICLKKKTQRMKNHTGKGEGSVNIGKQILSIRKAINTRGVWQIISCDTANGFKLGK